MENTLEKQREARNILGTRKATALQHLALSLLRALEHLCKATSKPYLAVPSFWAVTCSTCITQISIIWE